MRSFHPTEQQIEWPVVLLVGWRQFCAVLMLMAHSNGSDSFDGSCECVILRYDTVFQWVGRFQVVATRKTFKHQRMKGKAARASHVRSS